MVPTVPVESLPKTEQPVAQPKPPVVMKEVVEEKPKEMTQVEKMKAELRRWQKEQEKIEKVNKELGKIDANLVIMREPNKERKLEEEAPVARKTIHICVPCKRKFNSLGGLQTHFDRSEMHMVLYKLENKIEKYGEQDASAEHVIVVFKRERFSIDVIEYLSSIVSFISKVYMY